MATKRRTYTQAIINATASETYECQRALNYRGIMIVFVVGRVRYRMDKREKTSVRELEADGWKFKWRMEP